VANATKIGDAFEDVVYRYFLDLIEADRFYIAPQFCKVFQKKGYFSRDRGKEIVFDVSIEVTLEGRDTYSFLILIECKSLGRPVAVDDAEEFYAKVDQVAGKNVKGIIASRSSFQEGAIFFSASKGFGLLRILDRASFKWELSRSPSSLVSAKFASAAWVDAFSGVTNEKHRPTYFDCYAYCREAYTASIRMLFMKLFEWPDPETSDAALASAINPPNDQQHVVPFVSKTQIEEAAAQILQISRNTGGKVELEAICETLRRDRGLVTRIEKRGENPILGKISFRPLEIVIYESGPDALLRQRFTLAHELSHLLLGHGQFMAGEYCEEDDIDSETPRDLGVKDISRMEWQANSLASAMLMPKERFVPDFMHIARTLDLRDRGFGLIYLDSQKINIEAFNTVAHYLGARYGVSKAAVKVRLKRLGYLNEG
jgi:Zn-dependent peptidase ImmA (M78 family)